MRQNSATRRSGCRFGHFGRPHAQPTALSINQEGGTIRYQTLWLGTKHYGLVAKLAATHEHLSSGWLQAIICYYSQLCCALQQLKAHSCHSLPPALPSHAPQLRNSLFRQKICQPKGWTSLRTFRVASRPCTAGTAILPARCAEGGESFSLMQIACNSPDDRSDHHCHFWWTGNLAASSWLRMPCAHQLFKHGEDAVFFLEPLRPQLLHLGIQNLVHPRF